MWKEAAVLAGIVFLGLVASSQEKKEAPQEPVPAEFEVPPEEAKRKNPIKPDASSMAMGKRLFSSQCAMCHGKDGDGKGDLAEEMGLKLRDYRDPAALKEISDGELFYILSKGKGEMPGQGDRMSPEQRWHMINFIRWLAKKQPSRNPKGEKPQ
jgi:mono/diheme cytochrome c family protein